MDDQVQQEAELFEALAVAQAEFPEIEKTKSMDFPTKRGGRITANYADLGEIIAIILPILSKHGIALTQDVWSAENQIMVATNLRHKNGGTLKSAVLTMPCQMSDPKFVGAIITYSRRYSLQTFLCLPIVDEDEDAPEAKAKPQDFTQEKRALIDAMEKSPDWDEGEVKKLLFKKHKKIWPPESKDQWLDLIAVINSGIVPSEVG